ncbi:transcription factor bHLH149-like [Phragmites australis]|uniref:transcription factor bHLH149-like n=1 Tax=Phragmites australis TaxID=29695 RepID=UPI002D799A7F|nr:transcription factor bHLH149-like [Phragmites australis]
MISTSSSSAARMPGSENRPKPPAAAAPQTKWRSGTQHNIYGRRLLDALRATGAGQPRAIKAAADSALALTARGQTRWSRAILLAGAVSCRRRVLVKAGGKIRRHRRPHAKAVGDPPALKETKVKDRLRVLGRLVPGCRKLPAPALLEEAADYVAALEMQVKAMRALADALAAAQLSSPPPPPLGAGDEAEMEDLI